MGINLWKPLAVIVGVLAVLLGLGWGVRQYGNSRVAAQEIGTLKEVAQEAVQAHEAAVKVDVAQAKTIAVVRQRVRSVADSGRSADAQIRDSSRDCRDVDRLRVFNDAIDGANAVAERAAELPR